MDTEEHIEIQKAIAQGRPPTDEGPYYHEPWWESYKGGVKGYLGGAVAYTGVGAAIGIATIGVLALMGFTVAAVPVIAGFAAAGLLYGAHQFSDVGKIVGSGAAIAEKQDQIHDSKYMPIFSALFQKIDNLTAMVSGKKVAAAAESPATPSAESAEAAHRTTHMGDHPESGPWIFWKVAAVGLIAGLAAGGILAFGGTAIHLLGLMGVAEPVLLKASSVAVITAMGLFGASFGINRDLFRRIFDKTDLWFKGLFSSEQGLATQPGQSAEKHKEKPHPPIVTVVYPPDMPDFPTSDTHYRDKLAAAKQALHNLDPATTIRQ